MDKGVASQIETFYPDPLNLWLSVQCRPFEGGIVLFFRDVTAQRVSRQILLDQQATLAFVQQDAKRAIDTNTVSIVDYEVFTPEGGTLWVECRRVPVYNSAGVATHLRGMTTDITRRKRNEQELATRSEERR